MTLRAVRGCTLPAITHVSGWQALHVLAVLCSCDVTCITTHRTLEMALEKRTQEWEAAMATKEAVAAQACSRGQSGGAAMARLAALHEQRCRIVSAQLRHATQQLALAADGSKTAQVGSSTAWSCRRRGSMLWLVIEEDAPLEHDGFQLSIMGTDVIFLSAFYGQAYMRHMQAQLNQHLVWEAGTQSYALSRYSQRQARKSQAQPLQMCAG